jgi:hypothetical protein
MTQKKKDMCRNIIAFCIIESIILYISLLIIQNPEKYITILR